jgi:hypothetical protein
MRAPPQWSLKPHKFHAKFSFASAYDKTIDGGWGGVVVGDGDGREEWRQRGAGRDGRLWIKNIGV